MADFNQRFMRVKNAFSRAGSSIVSTLRLAGTNGDGTISLKEFMTALQRENVAINADELMYVYDFIDENKDGKIQYKELADVLQGRRQLNVSEHIAKSRKERGVDHGFTPSEMENIQHGSKQVSFDKKEVRSAGHVSNMSSVFKMSDPDERKVPPLTHPDEHQANLEVIRSMIIDNARSFDEILAIMGLSGSIEVQPKVSFDNFAKVVLHYCGT